MSSLRRKVAIRNQLRQSDAAAALAEKVSRATQIAHSTVPVGDADVPVAEAVADVAVVADDVSRVEGDTVLAGDDAYEAWQRADEVNEAVDEALAEAEQAAQDAAAALVGMNGKNARRAGKTEADLVPPETGWVDGDEWIVLNDAGVPVELRLRVGETWVPYNLIASSILVLGENGTVQIRDGLITAPKLAVDALNFKTAQGMELYGAKLVGGEILLADTLSEQTIWENDGESLPGWNGNDIRLSSVRVNGEHSVQGTVAESFAGSVVYTPDTATIGTGNKVTAWIRSSVKQEMFLRGYPSSSVNSIGVIEANTWVQIRVDVDPYIPYALGFDGSVMGSTIWVDSLVFSGAENSQTSGMRMFRDVQEVATLETTAGVTRTRMRGGVIESFNDNVPGLVTTVDPQGVVSKTPHGRAVSRLSPNALAFENTDAIGTGIPSSISHQPGFEGKPNSLALNAEQINLVGDISIQRDLWVKRTVTGLTWPGSGNGWMWTAAVRVTFPTGKFGKSPNMGGVHILDGRIMVFAMVIDVQQTYFEVRFLKYGTLAMTEAQLEYSAHER